MKILKNAGVWGGFILLLYSSIIFFQSFTLEYYNKLGPGPGFFPRWLSGLLIIFSLLYIWESIKNEVISTSEMLPKDKKTRQGIISTIVSVVLFMIIAPFAGFIISCSTMLFTMLIRDFKWYKALTASIIASFAILFIFSKLLGVELPTNSFGL